jgi:hypothetical protein
LFSFWFKSNRRNDRLLRAYLSDVPDPSASRREWGALVVLCLAVLAVLALVAGLCWWLVGLVF